MDLEELSRNFSILFRDIVPLSSDPSKGVLVEKKYEDTVHVHWCGKPERILAMCTGYYERSGIRKDFDQEQIFIKIIEGMRERDYYCIAFAHKQISKEEGEYLKQKGSLQLENMTLVGFVGIKNFVRRLLTPKELLSRYEMEVESVEQDCKMIGVDVKFITGYSLSAARAIDIAIYKRVAAGTGSGSVVKAYEFRSYTPEERMDKVDKIYMMVGSSSFDRSIMTRCLRQKGHVVSYTSLTDYPVFLESEANLRISLGMDYWMGTTTRDIVIMDKNFETVGTILKLGRRAYIQIQDVIQLQLTANIAPPAINFVAAISIGQIPLKTVQLLWVNLITVTLTTLALTTDQYFAKDAIIRRKPVHGTKPLMLITNIMWRNILAQAFYQIAVLLTLNFRGESIFGATQAVNETLIFNAFVLCQVFNQFNVMGLERKSVFKGVRNRKLFLGIVGSTILAQVAMVEFLKSFTGAERLNWGQWGACVAIAAISWPVDWIVKLPDKSFASYLKWKKNI